MALRPGLATGLPCSEKLNCLLNRWGTFDLLSNEFQEKASMVRVINISGNEQLAAGRHVADSLPDAATSA